MRLSRLASAVDACCATAPGSSPIRSSCDDGRDAPPRRDPRMPPTSDHDLERRESTIRRLVAAVASEPLDDESIADYVQGLAELDLGVVELTVERMIATPAPPASLPVLTELRAACEATRLRVINECVFADGAHLEEMHAAYPRVFRERPRTWAESWPRNVDAFEAAKARVRSLGRVPDARAVAHAREALTEVAEAFRHGEHAARLAVEQGADEAMRRATDRLEDQIAAHLDQQIVARAAQRKSLRAASASRSPNAAVQRLVERGGRPRERRAAGATRTTRAGPARPGDDEPEDHVAPGAASRRPGRPRSDYGKLVERVATELRETPNASANQLVRRAPARRQDALRGLDARERSPW
jgi:hypothetical protein